MKFEVGVLQIIPFKRTLVYKVRHVEDAGDNNTSVFLP